MDDYISRQAAIADAKSWIAVNSFEQNLQNKVIEWLKEFPPAQPAELETLIKALEQEHKKLREMQKALPEIIRCKDCKHHWTHKCMDSMPIEGCDLEQIFYDAEHDFCSLAERRTDDQRRSNQTI